MVKHQELFFWMILGGCCACLACHSIDHIKSHFSSPAKNAPPAINQQTDTVTIEIVTIRLAPHRHELLRQLWREADEQSLPPQLRRELLAEGFRVGTLDNSNSPALVQLLQDSSESQSDSPLGDFQEFSAADIARELTVSRHVRNLLPEMRALIKIFDEQQVLPGLALFQQENGMLEGQTYREALGIFCVSAVANKDGSAQIQIVPKLEHGLLERRVRTVAGMVVQEQSRPRRSFDTLTISQRLLPGQWILLGTTTPD